MGEKTLSVISALAPVATKFMYVIDSKLPLLV